MPKRFVLFLCLSLAQPCWAEYEAKDWVHLKAMPAFKEYIGGVGVAYGIANVVLRGRKQKPLFCVPPSLALQNENYIDIIDRSLQSGVQFPADTPLELILIHALEDAFPCNQDESYPSAPPRSDQPAFQPLRFKSTIWDTRAESARGCLGELELTATKLLWHDEDFCWNGPDVASPLTQIEWISYDRWKKGTEATVKLQSLTYPLKFSLPGTVALKLIRHLTLVSPVSRQHCGESLLQRDSATGSFDTIRTPVLCSAWLND